ncbi:pyruvate-flavodoxin oxidoreductase-related [Anaeramoeba ignava]|uniref:pyruvate dehydrogenase (NADP(+)) n=1 Tax=Anaeramoeba ignava TaxID=1746090 RepID=A0A9Q0LAI9_ANAIG|nr:pyruvate-flavodoxin oxidoreductase-related [Anaeramoeba ignava]
MYSLVSKNLPKSIERSKKELLRQFIRKLANKTKLSHPMDGNTAAAHIAYGLSDQAFIYPITPSSPMGELADMWSAQGKKNAFGRVVDVTEMQAEGGAAGALHGSLSAGGLSTTFTASQGLLLMLPNMFKISGELLPTVFHVAARAVAGQALSIFGDHSDVMACRTSGFAFLSSGSVQEIMDLAIVAHIASMESSIPFCHFFEGFRLSHEINTIETVPYDQLHQLIDKDLIEKIRKRGLNPEFPHMRGTSQGPDVYFQLVESANKYYDNLAEKVQDAMNRVAKITGRQYNLFDYVGAKDAERVIVVMGSGASPIEEVIAKFGEKEKIGLIKCRLYRPFSKKHLLEALPKNVKRICVLDRTKEPGALGEPLYLDVSAAVKELGIEVYGGRYGLGSKDFTPAMALSVYENLNQLKPMNNFSVGIEDDVTFKSLKVGEEIDTVPEGTQQCMFWGMGSDGTVGANKNAIKIIADNTPLYGQGYFYYSAHKSGGLSVSHLRFGPNKIDSPYLIQNADYIACHNTAYIHKYDILDKAKKGSIFVLNSPWNSLEELDKQLPGSMKRKIAEKNLKFYNIDANSIANQVGLSGRINMIMQAVFFHLSGVLPSEKAIKLLKEAIVKEYGKKGQDIVNMNHKGVDHSISNIHEIKYPKEWTKAVLEEKEDMKDLPDFIRDVMKPMARLDGDKISISKLPEGGFVPLGTSQYDKRGIAEKVPKWDPTNCTQCNFCSFVCPHAVIRPFLLNAEEKSKSPNNFQTVKANGVKEDLQFRIQVSPLDCTGCGLCANTCPEHCLTMTPLLEMQNQIPNWNFAMKLPVRDDLFKRESIKGSQFQKPLLEFSGACGGCGETPYVKLITQLFGEQMVVANATGCSSIWGGSYPNCPYTTNKEGHGPAWGNSLFEDNAEYGLGMAKAIQNQRNGLAELVEKAIKSNADPELNSLFKEWIENFNELRKSKELSGKIKEKLSKNFYKNELLGEIYKKRDLFSKRSQWIIGGDGWAYDIGYGGLDHVIASGEDVNVLVLDTEVYSNTGGQSSKSTPRSGVAKFAAKGKNTRKKDLGLMATTYGNVYVASVSLSNMKHLLKCLVEAENWKGPSLIIAYAPCIEHGIRAGMITQLKEQELAVKTGYWSLFHFDPKLEQSGKNPFVLDSRKPSGNLLELLKHETRFASLMSTFPEEAKIKHKQLQDDILKRYETYVRLSQKFEAKKNKKKK